MKTIEFSKSALAEVKNIMSKKGIPEGYGLRVGAKGAGCGGMSFALGFDKKKETDDHFDVEGIPVYVEKRHVMYLLGMVVDFYEGSEARGFLFLKKEDFEGELV
ncbi:iron-sulfur cluster assembly accessory protein [Mangrovivirga sp. M17]|uniref:Iron-sulfur cluster assembly accessory protein n=1 Tax=Mangrovivirga halotolerans TaxID=2993936 RepID=A0ABT3RUQ5_9BACT|nr:iron-sulfur cluster assembly accessory protein [Mangrovivirga halotolerans]MCX2744982.1 iron-sulfur cluster assembly accessory protein [Mangrovivirga halotolerans]